MAAGETVKRRHQATTGDLLRCVDPYDVQVAEVDALLVQESGAGAAFGPHMAPLGDGGGSGCHSGRR